MLYVGNKVEIKLQYIALYILSLFPRIVTFWIKCLLYGDFHSYQFKSKLTFVHIGNREGLIEHICVSIML